MGMKCVCGSEVPEDNRFCGRCGRETRPSLHCEKCGSENPPDNRFCGRCGLRLLPGVTASIPDNDATLRLDLGETQTKTPPSVFSQAEVTLPAAGRLSGEVNRMDAGIRGQPIYSAGPSLLGLSSASPTSDEDGDYLLDENPQRTVSWRAWALVVLLTVAGILGWLEWKSVSTLAMSKHSLAVLLGAPEGQGQTATAPPLPSASPTPVDVDAQGNNQQKSAEENRSQQGSGSQSSPDSNSQSNSNPQTQSQSHSKDQEGSGATDVSGSGKTETMPGGSDTSDHIDKPESDEAAERPRHPAISAAAGNNEEADQTAAKPAAARGHSAAKQTGTGDPLFDRGQLYLRMHNCEQGLIYLRAAAEKPDPRAQVQLGAMYMTGNCVAKDRVAAYRWFSSAQDLEPNNQWVAKNLNMLWQQMTPAERNRAR